MQATSRTTLTLIAGLLVSLTAFATAPRDEITPFQPAGSSTDVSDLNDLGHAVGRHAIFYAELGYARWATLLSLGGTHIDLASRGAHFEPAALNNRDQVAGKARDEASGRALGYFYTGSQVLEIASPGGPTGPFIWRDGVMADLRQP